LFPKDCSETNAALPPQADPVVGVAVAVGDTVIVGVMLAVSVRVYVSDSVGVLVGVHVGRQLPARVPVPNSLAQT
jgi:hypothetical protein